MPESWWCSCRPGGDELRFVAVAGEERRSSSARRCRATGSKSGRVLERGRSERSRLGARRSRGRPRGRRAASAPDRALGSAASREDRPIGVIAAHDKLGRDARFSDNDLRLAETFATRAAVAVDLSQRIERDALRRVVDAQELERRRLARELHDETGQALTSILLGLRALEDCSRATTPRRPWPSSASSSSRRCRTCAGSRSSCVRRCSTTSASCRRSSASPRPSASRPESSPLRSRALGDERLPRETETALYRIVQEALTNIVKHAQARNVSIVLTRKPGSVAAVIEDDGQGFDPDDSRDGGFGLEGMRERVALLDGRLEVESSAEAGTTLVAEVPVHERPRPDRRRPRRRSCRPAAAARRGGRPRGGRRGGQRARRRSSRRVR